MINYREAKLTDLEAIAELETNAFFDYPLYWDVLRHKFHNDAEYRKFLRLILTIELKADLKRGHGQVALVDGEIACVAFGHSLTAKPVGLFEYVRSGALKLLPYYKKLNLHTFLKEMGRAESASLKPSSIPSWYLSILAVSPQFQGKHLGSGILEDLIFPTLQQQGISRITLMTNTAANCHFYQQNGFESYQHIVLDFDGKAIDNWTFSKSLAD